MQAARRLRSSRYALIVAAAWILGVAAAACAEPPAVSVTPVDGAEFLPGARFDLSVELFAPSLPEDLRVTVNGVEASGFFGKPMEKLNRSAPPAAVMWRGVAAPAPGTYRVDVHAAGSSTVARWVVRPPRPGEAKNVVLLVADGMTVAQLTAARVISRGMTLGKYDGALAIDRLDEIGLVHTSGIESIIADSANTSSAMNTGHKTREEQTGGYPDSTASPFDDPQVETFAELVTRKRGMAVGVVSTADWTDATTAGVFGHCANRYPSCRTLFAAAPLDEGPLLDVILGGGARWMFQQGPSGARNLFEEYTAAGYSLVTTATDLAAAVKTKPARLLGLFHPGHLNVWIDRNVYRHNLGKFPDQPGLPEMALAALDVLHRNPNGFFVLIEAASVDKQMHHRNHERALADLIEFDQTVAAVRDWVGKHATDTLIVVTSDHGQGYEVFGTVDVKAFRRAKNRSGKLNAIRTWGKAGFPTYEDANGDGFPDDWNVDIALAGQQNNYPPHSEDHQLGRSPTDAAAVRLFLSGGSSRLESENPGIDVAGNLPPAQPESGASAHTMQDVPIFAAGPGAAYFGRVIDNTEIFFGMAAAIGLDPSAKDGRAEAAGKASKPSPVTAGP